MMLSVRPNNLQTHRKCIQCQRSSLKGPPPPRFQTVAVVNYQDPLAPGPRQPEGPQPPRPEAQHCNDGCVHTLLPSSGQTGSCRQNQKLQTSFGWIFFFFLLQTVILIWKKKITISYTFHFHQKLNARVSEQNRLQGLLHVKELQNRKVLVWCHEQIYIYLYLLKKKYFVTLLLDYSHSLVFSNLHDNLMKPLNFLTIHKELLSD